MNLKALRKQCEARLSELDLPTPFDVRTFCEVVAGRRGRPIVLRPIVTHSGPWGLWAAGPSADYVFYESDTSVLHQEHIILHELSHLICGHRPTPVAEPAVVADLFPDLSPESVRRVLSRAAYTAADEQEAEVLASVLLKRIAAARPRGDRASPGLAATEVEVLGRLGKALQSDPEDGP